VAVAKCITNSITLLSYNLFLFVTEYSPPIALLFCSANISSTNISYTGAQSVNQKWVVVMFPQTNNPHENFYQVAFSPL